MVKMVNDQIKNSFKFVIILGPALRCDASGTWYLSVNTYSTYGTLQTSAFITILVVTKVTTVHLNLESSRSFEVSINTRIPKHFALADIIALLLLLLFFCFSGVLCQFMLRS